MLTCWCWRRLGRYPKIPDAQSKPLVRQWELRSERHIRVSPWEYMISWSICVLFVMGLRLHSDIKMEKKNPSRQCTLNHLANPDQDSTLPCLKSNTFWFMHRFHHWWGKYNDGDVSSIRVCMCAVVREANVPNSNQQDSHTGRVWQATTTTLTSFSLFLISFLTPFITVMARSHRGKRHLSQ